MPLSSHLSRSIFPSLLFSRNDDEEKERSHGGGEMSTAAVDARADDGSHDGDKKIDPDDCTGDGDSGGGWPALRLRVQRRKRGPQRHSRVTLAGDGKIKGNLMIWVSRMAMAFNCGLV